MYKFFFNRKKELLILAAIIIICTLVPKFISIFHWHSLDWNVTGYAPELAPMFMLLGVAMMANMHIRHYKAISLWIMAIALVCYGAVMFWMVNLGAPSL